MVISVLQKMCMRIFSVTERSKHLSRLCRNLSVPILGKIDIVYAFIINGLVNNEDISVRILFLGSEDAAYQFISSMCWKFKSIEPLGRFFYSYVNSSKLKDVDIVVFKKRVFIIGKMWGSEGFILPTLEFNLDLNQSIEEVINRSSRRRRRSVRQLQKLGYSYTISKNRKEDFDFFYWKMYLPYTKKRFGKAAIISSYSTLESVYEKGGGILFVNKGDEHIFGLFFLTDGKTLFAKNIGILDAKQKFLKELAGQAALWFLINWAKNEGIRCLNYGVTIPFFNDGIFRYKKEWGMYLNQHQDQLFSVLKLNRINEKTLHFLHDNPFICIDENMMKGIIFIDYKPKYQDLKQIFSRYFSPKIDSILVITYYRSEEKTANIISSSTSDNFMTTILRPLETLCTELEEQGFCVEAYKLLPCADYRLVCDTVRVY